MSINRFSFGSVPHTEVVTLNIKKSDNNLIPYFKINNSNELIYNLYKDQVIYGLGENVRGINKKGWIYESFCSDEFDHTEDKRSIYSAHNFIIIHGKETFGVFIDCPGRVIFDLGYTKCDEISIKVPENDYDLYIIKGQSLNLISKEFRKLVGSSYIPPKWAFGYQQSRWGYKSKDDILDIVKNFKKNNIPLDGICLDIDYMESFKDFTINKDTFGGFKDFVESLKKEGIRLIPIIDAGVKIEDGYDVYEEGVEKGYFCVDKNNKPFVAAVWPGKVHFPDFLNEETRKWFGKKYKMLINNGIEGFWNDMNEPAIFYSEESLREALDKAEKSKGKNLDVYSFFNLKDSFLQISNNIKDYKRFYHNLDGKLIRHDKVHNIYGYNMTKAAAKAFNVIKPSKRFLLFSRASCIGMHRYSGIWTGDNKSWWQHLEMNIKMMPNLNICGFLYSGADTGGFGSDTTSDLLIRWNQFSMFTPLFRNHSSKGTRQQEPYKFDEDTIDTLKNVIENRYAFIPYIYSEYMKAAKNDDCYFKAITFEYENEDLIEDQLLVGDSLMIAPIYKQNVKGRYVYLPEDMLFWNMESYKNKKLQILNKGHHYINVPLKSTPIFIRKNKALILGEHNSCVDKLKNQSLDVIAFMDKEASYIYYDDDGITKEYKHKDYELKIYIKKVEDDYKIDILQTSDSSIKKINFNIIDINSNKITKQVFLK
ncbi:TIM-barrel domain-containing protein [Clostridium rectalis]|uniref:glycoside hydrolase family 31 protein n=1 Tax=Clostridium rectalis TaxID=2040295 RepID=UPI000F63F7CA|nr:TIM-barrel domain-containing protein [Clostridium rectalis]